jgi:hypothetical protein
VILAERCRSAGRRAVPAFLFALLVVGVYSDPLFFRRNFAGRDLLVYHLPIEHAIHDAYSRGRLPVWIPHISGGRPLAANPNTGALYPARPILSVVPFPLAARLFPILHWIAAGIGVMLLLRSVRVSRSGAWAGAVTYVFSGVGVNEVFYLNIQPGMALLPWIVWAVAREETSRGRKVALLSFLLGLDLLAGDVFTIAIALVSSVLWIAVERVRAERLGELVTLSLAVLLGGLLAAPQILGTLLWIPETNRAILGMKLEESFFFSLHPLRLLELLVPFPFGRTWTLESWNVWGPSVFHGKEMGFFSTLYAGALAVIGLATAWMTRSVGARFARLLFLVSLVFMIPTGLLSARFGKVASPLPLRYPEKFAVALTLALAFLAALAFDHHRWALGSSGWTLPIAGLLAGLAAASALFSKAAGRLAVRVVGSDASFAEVAADRLAPALAEGALLWIATVVALDLLRRPSPAALAVSVVLVTLVPIAANRKIARTIPEEQVFLQSPFARYLGRIDPAGEYRTFGEGPYGPMSEIMAVKTFAEPEGGGEDWTEYRQALAGRGTVFNVDFDAGDFARVESLRKLVVFATSYRDSQSFFQNLSLRWGIRFRDQQPVPGYERIGGIGVEQWDELRGSLPDIRLAQVWREESSAVEAVKALPALPPGALVVETGHTLRGVARPGSVEVLEKTPERLILRTHSLDRTWLFALRGFWAYREVRLDGREVECFPAQLGFSAVPVPSGTHIVDWSEQLPGWEVSRWGPVLFGLVTVLYLSRQRRLRREPGTTTSRV